MKLDIGAVAVKYMAEMMDMHEPLDDQEQNQLLRHLSQFGQRAFDAAREEAFEEIRTALSLVIGFRPAARKVDEWKAISDQFPENDAHRNSRESDEASDTECHHDISNHFADWAGESWKNPAAVPNATATAPRAAGSTPAVTSEPPTIATAIMDL